MANRKRPAPKRPAPRPAAGGAKPPRPPAPTSTPTAGPNRMPWIIGGAIAAIVLIVAVIAIAAGGGGGDDDAGQQFWDVTVTGAPLERLPDDGDDPDLGATPPTLTGYGFDGAPIAIDPASGRPTMVVFLAHWCPHCNREVPRLVEWNDAGEVPADLQIIGVSTGASDEAPNWPPSEWIQDLNWPWPVMADSQDQVAAQAYGLPGYPYFVLIGADGEVKYRQSGEVPIDQLEQILADAGIQ
jgi:cytochrome c biogenesis protein CcmG/thiol:disulfide interchange protein DsbE